MSEEQFGELLGPQKLVGSSSRVLGKKVAASTKASALLYGLIGYLPFSMILRGVPFCEVSLKGFPVFRV